MKILVSCPEGIFSFGQDKDLVCDEGKKVNVYGQKKYHIGKPNGK